MATRLQIFTRAPKLGKVKTRLEPFLGQEGCLSLHRCLIEHALDLAAGWRHGLVEIWLAVSDTENQSFQRAEYIADIRSDLKIPESISIQIQQGNNLGDRIQFAIESALELGDASLLIGTDCPEQSLAHLEQAWTHIEERPALVIQPAIDGGFVLIACPASLDLAGIALGSGIDWGTDQVLDQLENKLQGQGLTYDKIETVSDLDEEEDFLKLQSDKHPFVDQFYKAIKKPK